MWEVRKVGSEKGGEYVRSGREYRECVLLLIMGETVQWTNVPETALKLPRLSANQMNVGRKLWEKFR